MLKAAIYGLGRWGNRLVDSVQGSEKIRFVKGISRDPAKHKEFSQKTGVKVVSSYGRVLKDPEIDAVVLATPHTQHMKQIIQAAKAGKHVFVEKPMTLTRKTAEKSVEACKAAGVTLGVGFNRRHAPSFIEMTNRIRAGQIGKVLHIEAAHSGPTGYGLKPDTWRSSRIEAPGGGMTARGVHALDAMIQIAGLVTSVYAFSDNRNLPAGVDMDDTTTMMLKFSSGATGYLSALFTTGELYRVHVFGTKGWLEVRGDTDLTFRGIEGGPEKVSLQAADKEKAELEAFADAVAAKKPFAIPAEDAINNAAVLEAIVASAKKGKAVTIG
ncbi:MAG TPA: Gfo/Idh/MocA family oxidoreductase [Burkholderiales bacterium]|nr:Gfo/Idh/MocA family oxidoreductase [Burkholderiales bacterium]